MDAPDFAVEGVRRWQQDYQPERPLPPAGVFEVGLCMAGAISAGAYTAGVLDFLIEALDAFAEERERRARSGSPFPLHEVRMPVLGGASAGGMCAAIAAMFLDTRFPPVRMDTPREERDRNPLYRAWVSGIDIRPMLGDRDARRGRPASLLDSTPLDGLVDDLLDRRASATTEIAPRPWLAGPLRVVLTLSNLRGVPYLLRTENGKLHHWMAQHADHVRFAVRLHPLARAAEVPGEGPKVGETVLDCAMPRDDVRWERFKAVALGTGGFPVFLAPRVMLRPAAEYEYRAALTPTSPLCDASRPGETWDWAERLVPAWPQPRSEEYAALCVDGGAMNNEPLDLVRRVMAGYRGASPREPAKACRALVLIDPFTNPGKLGPEKAQGLLGSVLPFFTALMQNARFKPEDLAMADAEDIGSRFLIAPSRDEPSAARVTADGIEAEPAIAAGHLHGFLGFFAEAYREHDFFLGRRNAQRFLREHFALPEDNEVLRGRWSEEDKDRWCAARRSAGEPRHLQVIPLCGSAATVEEALPPWPARRFDAAEIEPLVARRVATVLPALRDAALGALSKGQRRPSLFRRLGAWAIGWWLRPRIVEKVMEKLQAETAKLDQRGA